MQPGGVVVVGIDSGENPGTDPFAKAREFQQKHSLTYPILVDADGKTKEALAVSGLPTNVLIDREGKIRAIVVGFDSEQIEKTLRELTAGK